MLGAIVLSSDAATLPKDRLESSGFGPERESPGPRDRHEGNSTPAPAYGNRRSSLRQAPPFSKTLGRPTLGGRSSIYPNKPLPPVPARENYDKSSISCSARSESIGSFRAAPPDFRVRLHAPA